MILDQLMSMMLGRMTIVLVIDLRFLVYDNRDFQNLLKVENKFSENIPARLYGYALVLMTNLVSISSDGERQLDSI